MNTEHRNTECIPQQIKVFSKWVKCALSNNRLDVTIKDITKDLKDGVILVELSEVLVCKLAPRDWELQPKRTEDMIHNSELAIEMFTKDGVHLNGITGKEVTESKEKFILGLLWTIILHYSIDKSVRFSNDNNKVNDNSRFSSTSKVSHYVAQKHYKQALMQWALDRIESYPGIAEFQPLSLALCALLDSYFPEKVNYFTLDPKDTETVAKVASQAMKELNIPLLFDLSELQSSKIDDKALLTQLSVIKIAIERRQPTQRTISKSRTLILDDEFVSHKEEGNNKKYAAKKFGLIMKLKETDYKNGQRINPLREQVCFGEDVELALTVKNVEKPFLNPSGRKLDMERPDIKNDSSQQFVFGEDRWNTVIDSIVQRGMVWDVADEFNQDPPAGTPFYIFPFHGRHNQHFVYKNGMIYAQQNGHVVTYVGGEEPFIMMPPSKTLKARQTFRIQLI